MKVTIEYELPEEQESLDLAMQGRDWRNVVQALDGWFRNQTKHGDTKDLDVYKIREHLHALVDEYDLDLS